MTVALKTAFLVIAAGIACCRPDPPIVHKPRGTYLDSKSSGEMRHGVGYERWLCPVCPACPACPAITCGNCEVDCASKNQPKKHSSEEANEAVNLPKIEATTEAYGHAESTPKSTDHGTNDGTATTASQINSRNIFECSGPNEHLVGCPCEKTCDFPNRKCDDIVHFWCPRGCECKEGYYRRNYLGLQKPECVPWNEC